MSEWLKKIKEISLEQVPTTEPERQYYFMEIAKRYVEQLANQKGSPLTFCVTTFGCQMNARDSEKLVGILELVGYEMIENEQADFERIVKNVVSQSEVLEKSAETGAEKPSFDPADIVF